MRRRSVPGKTVSVAVSSCADVTDDFVMQLGWLIGCKCTVRALFCRSGMSSTSVRKSCRISERASSEALDLLAGKLGARPFQPGKR